LATEEWKFSDHAKKLAATAVALTTKTLKKKTTEKKNTHLLCDV
jgi:hypothetical protein